MTTSTLESQETRLSKLPRAEREEILADLDLETLAYNWRYSGRVDQLEVTDSPASLVAFIAGRGAGKTRTGAEWIRDKIERKPDGHPPLLFSLLARTAADCRDVQVQGESGLLNVFPPSQRPEYVSSQRLVKFHDGSTALMFSSIEPGQLRGPQSHYTWVDELAALSHAPDDSGLTAWENAQIGCRLGQNPQILATTTPKRVKAVRELYARAKAGKGVHLVTGASTFDNPFLAASYLNMLRNMYGGTRLESQELFAQMMSDVEGALWKLADIEFDRAPGVPGRLPLCVVGVDPSVSDTPGDECGIVISGATGGADPLKRHAYVLEDRSLQGPPSVWVQTVVDAANDYNAPVVVEINNGGAFISDAIHAIDPRVRVRTVHAKKGKALRAEPVAMASDQHRIHHVGVFPDLEDQMTSWISGKDKNSPDRLDAYVYSLLSLIAPSSYKTGVGKTTVKAARGQLPLGRAGILSQSPGR